MKLFTLLDDILRKIVVIEKVCTSSHHELMNKTDLIAFFFEKCRNELKLINEPILIDSMVIAMGMPKNRPVDSAAKVVTPWRICAIVSEMC